MAERKYCLPCGEEHRPVLATVVIDGDPMCAAHARMALPVQVAVEEVEEPVVEETTVEDRGNKVLETVKGFGARKVATTPEVIAAIQAMPAEIPHTAVAKALGVSDVTVRKYRRMKIQAEAIEALGKQPILVQTQEIPADCLPAGAAPKVAESVYQPLGSYPWPQPKEVSLAEQYDGVIADLTARIDMLIGTRDTLMLLRGGL